MFCIVSHGSRQHQRLIAETVIKLRSKGYHAINTNGISPDAIAVKDGKIYAVEVLLISKIPEKGWRHMSVVRNKRDRYCMFDDVIFEVANKEHKILSDEDKEQLAFERSAKKIVNNFIVDEIGDRE